MNKERALLKQIQQFLLCDCEDIYGFVGDIEHLLAQPEPPKHEPLSEEAVGELLMDGFSTHLMDLVRMVEKAHGIGVEQ